MVQRDIVWISLESVRQDHTTLGGHDRDTTPNLARLAADPRGAAFGNCFSHGIWTRTSSTSILTGRAPADHGVLAFDSKLSPEVATIPEQLAAAGYHTACVSPIAQVSEATGLDRGFDDFHYLNYDTLLQEAGPLTMAKFLLNLNRHSAGLTTDTKKHCIGYLGTEIAKRHIRQAETSEDPLFLYTHIGDSHHAYYPPKGWRTQFEDDLELPLEDALAVSLDMSDRLVEHIANGASFSEAEWNAIEVMYDQCLLYVDHLAGIIVEAARKRLDDPIIVVTADHGELLGEQGLLAHMLVANTAVSNVPMVVYGVDGLAGSDELVQHADAMRMALHECGVEIPVPAGFDLRDSERPFAVTQRGGKRAAKKVRQLKDQRPDYDESAFPEGDLTSIRTRDFRYQRSDSGEGLFRLPDEVVDVSGAHPDELERMQARCTEWLDEHSRTRVSEGEAAFSRNMERQLRDLGYL
ncbi:MULTISPECIES: sulfatase [Haloarcula]|uniref:sulfatase n=1 Tax=Haloarcula TaxID=2237 RepID=UPI0023ED8377|nr:sulfatase [Halomicroarcula sp. XH51]